MWLAQGDGHNDLFPRAATVILHMACVQRDPVLDSQRIGRARGCQMSQSTADSDRMTVQGLLDEALMSGARVIAGAHRLDAELSWVLPLNEVLAQPDRLDAVAVYARPEALVGNGATLSTLGARGATALVVDGVTPADVARTALPPSFVIIEMGIPVGFAALNRLLAERALSQEVHVMRY